MLYGDGRQGQKAPSPRGGEGQGTETLGVGDGEQTRLKTGDPDQCPMGLGGLSLRDRCLRVRGVSREGTALRALRTWKTPLGGMGETADY